MPCVKRKLLNGAHEMNVISSVGAFCKTSTGMVLVVLVRKCFIDLKEGKLGTLPLRCITWKIQGSHDISSTATVMHLSQPLDVEPYIEQVVILIYIRRGFFLLVGLRYIN